MVALYRSTTAARTAEAEIGLTHAAEHLAAAYDFYTTGLAATPAGPGFARGLGAVVHTTLARAEGVEGGIWQQGRGSLAYAYPTYEGSGSKTDLPAAETAAIAAINTDVEITRAPAARREIGRRETLLLYARPLSSPVLPGASAWVMTRVAATPAFARLQAALASLLFLVLLLAFWLWRLARSFGRHVGAIEAALRIDDIADLPPLPATGENDLDRILASLNEAVARLSQTRAEAALLARRAAEAERLAALGRVAAGIAHEIRNPLAAMRLRAENALAGDPPSGRAANALVAILGQIARLDRLVHEILNLTQRPRPRLARVDLSRLLAAVIAEHGEIAVRASVRLQQQGPALTAVLDLELTRRALAALLDNAIRHTPAGGMVGLRADREGEYLILRVADTGPGIAAELRDCLFEPFVSFRPEGTGLGLAIAREMAEAQSGMLSLLDPGGAQGGAVFGVILPWHDPETWPES